MNIGPTTQVSLSASFEKTQYRDVSFPMSFPCSAWKVKTSSYCVLYTGEREDFLLLCFVYWGKRRLPLPNLSTKSLRVAK